MRILVTGSRDWTDWQELAFQLFKYASSTYEHVTVVHGHCPTGADAMADYVGAELLGFMEISGVSVERHPADWDKYGKRAGFIRNDQMVQLGADICLAFIKNESKGATMTARIAEAAGIPVRRFLA